MLEDARLGEPQTLLYYSDATEISRHIAAAASIWDRELNLELEVIEVSLAQRRRAMTRFEDSLRRVSVTPFIPGPLAYFDGVVDALSPASPESAELFDMVADYRQEQDEAKRVQLCEEIRRFIESNALVIPLFATTGTRKVLVQPWLRGFDPPRYQGSRFKDVWIDEDHPAYFPLD